MANVACIISIAFADSHAYTRAFYRILSPYSTHNMLYTTLMFEELWFGW